MSDQPQMEKIGGKLVDINDPCQLVQALQAYRVKLATGGAVQEIEIRSPLTTRRTKFSASSSLADLDKMIEESRTACQAKIGAPPAPRKRYAISARARPY